MLGRGDLAQARERLSEGLAKSVALGDQAKIADYLAAAGRLAAATTRWEPAARLLSAATALYQTVGIEPFPDHRGEHERAQTVAQAGLGNEAFSAARAAGQALRPEQAIAEAYAVVRAPHGDDRRRIP